VRKGEQPPWIVPDELWTRTEPLPAVPRRTDHPGRKLHCLRIRWEIRDDIHEAFLHTRVQHHLTASTGSCKRGNQVTKGLR
jgi:hypothetical protein